MSQYSRENKKRATSGCFWQTPVDRENRADVLGFSENPGQCVMVSALHPGRLTAETYESAI